MRSFIAIAKKKIKCPRCLRVREIEVKDGQMVVMGNSGNYVVVRGVPCESCGKVLVYHHEQSR